MAGVGKITDIGYDGSKIYGTRGNSIGYRVWDLNFDQRIEDVLVDLCFGCIESQLYQMAVADSINLLFIEYRKTYQIHPTIYEEFKFIAFVLVTKQKK